MKQRIIIIAALTLILVVILFIVKDLFYENPDKGQNPYEYDMSMLRNIDSNLVMWKEIHKFKPEMSEIYGIAVDSKNRIYVSGKDSVEIFENSGKPINKFKIEGIARCITINPKGNILLGIMDHVEIWDESGKLLNKWPVRNDKSIFTSIAATDSFVYIADAGNAVVYRYDYNGKILNKIGEKDPEKGIKGFIIPSLYFDLLIGKKDELWVVNPGMHSFDQFTPDGTITTSWAKTSMELDGFSGCCNPSHTAVLSDGSFVTSEKGIERIKVHTKDGAFKCVVATPDQFKEGTRGLDLAVDSKDRILVLDPVKQLVRIFVEKKK